MQNVLETGKRALSAAVAAATIALSIGVAGVLSAPATTHAAAAGDLFKSTSLKTVYYYGYDGMRYVFPNEKTYKSWYMTAAGAADFSDVATLSDSAVSDITLGGNVAVRPGTYWIKVTSDDKVYAVARNGAIHWIESEDVATDFAGSNWNQRIIDVPDVFFTDYTVGTSLMTATAYEGMMYDMGGDTYLVWDDEMRMVSTAGMSANGLMSTFVMDGSGIDDSALSLGSDLTSADTAVSDAAQTETDSSTTTGALTLSASSSMPPAASLPGGANAVEVFRFNAKAGSEDASLDGVTFSLTGAGATANISNVYLYEGTTRLTESRSVNSSTRQTTFSNLGLDVGAGETRTFTVRVTTSTTQVAADTFGFKIAAASDVTAGGDVSGSYPITGSTFTFTGADAGTLEVDKTGSIDDPTLGEQDAVIGQFKITADGTEAASVESIMLKVDNASDHSNFRLLDGNTLLDEGENTSGDWVLFDLSSAPFAIEEGGSNIFSVTADIGGQDADTVKVYVDNTVDVVALGGDYGFGLTVDTATDGTYDGTSCTSSSGNCSFSTIVGGKLTFAFNGPTSGDVQVDSQDQTILSFAVTAAQAVTIKDLDIQVAADDDDDGDPTDGVEAGAGTTDDDGLINTGAEANLKDIKIVNADTGAVVMGPMELDSVTDSEVNETSLTGAAEDALQIIDFTDDFSMEAGETLNLEVRVDVDNGLTANETVAAIFDMSGLSAEDENGDALSLTTDVVPGTDMTGYNQTARSATLVFALASTPTDTTTVDGTDNVSVLGMTVTAGAASDVTITDLTMSAYGDFTGDASFTLGGETSADINDYVESCTLYDDTTLVAGPEAPATNGETIGFDSIDWTIDAGEVAKLTMKCSFANTSTANSSYFAFDLVESDTDVVAEDESGTALATTAVTGEDFNGNASPTTVVTLADSGTIAVAAGSDSPSADFVLTASSNTQVATYRFTATDEAFEVQTLSFSEEQSEDDAASADSSAYANNISLVTITYPKADGTTGTKTASMSGNEVKFSSLDMYVPVNTPKDVKVYVNVPATDRDSSGSATSNERIRLGLFVDTTNDDNFKAVGSGSGTTKDDDDQGAIGDDSTDGIATFVVKETKPTITLSSSSPSGSASGGRSEVLRFNVAASANEDVVLNSMVFKINTTDNAGTGTNDWNTCDNAADAGEMAPQDFDLYNLTDDGTSTTLDNSSATDQNDSLAEMSAGTDSPWTLLKATGAICDSTEADVGFVHLTLPASEIIPKGVTKTFALYIDATGASTSSDDSLRVDLPTDPIVGTYIDSTTDSNVTGLAATATSLGVDDSTVFAVGDVIVLDADGAGGDGVDSADERMLVTALPTSTTLTVVRGYLASPFVATADVTNTDTVYRLPGSFLWKDDGVAGTTVVTGNGSADDYWGSYLVDNLSLTGGTLVF